MIEVTSRLHFSTLRKNIFLWVEEVSSISRKLCSPERDIVEQIAAQGRTRVSFMSKGEQV